MAKTQKLWAADEQDPAPLTASADLRGSGRASPGMVAASLLTAMILAYTVLAFHPRLVLTVTTAWSAWGEKPGWAMATLAAGAITAGAASGLLLLSAVARGVQSAPYAWSAPGLVAAAWVQSVQLDFVLPLPGLSLVTFATCSALLMLVGGGLLQLRGWTFTLSGLLLLSLPLLTLASGYALTSQGLTASLASLPSSGRLFLLLQALTSLGAFVLAQATRAAGEQAEPQVERWKTRAQRSELRAAYALRRAEIAEERLLAQGPPGLGIALRSSGSGMVLGASTLVLAIALLAGYFGAYRPLVERSRVQRDALIEAARGQGLAVEVARQQLEAERAALGATLAGTRAKGGAAVRAPGEASRSATPASPSAAR